MDFDYEYSIRLNKVEEQIKKALPSKAGKEWISRVAGEKSPLGQLSQYDSFIEPARDLIRRGGKRWRPVVMLLSCETAGGKDEAVPFVPLVELPHNGSLIVDDIEDKSEWRRGEKAVHLLYGEDLAVNAGNLLYYLPTYIIEESGAGSGLKAGIYRYYTENMRRLHLGQGFDILWHRNGDIIPEPEEYEQMCRFKTGSLARMAAQIGAWTASEDADAAEVLGSVCEDMGVGFQIMDDVVNLTSGNPGKGRGDDIVEGKKSLPVIYHLISRPGDRDKMVSLFRSAGSKGFDKAENEIEEAISMMEKSGAIDKAKERGKELLSGASKRLSSSFPPCGAVDIMKEMIVKFADSY